MTTHRYGPTPPGEYTALSAARPLIGAQPELSAPPTTAPPPPPLPLPPAAPPATTPGAAARPWVPTLPPQHGAWAFLVVPVLFGFAVAGVSLAGWVLLAAWVCAYPVGYYAGRALTARARRGAWTRLARRELGRALPWAALTLLLGLPLAVTRPWLLAAAAMLGVVWALGLWVAARRGERSMANDLLLVAQAVAAVPLTVAVVAGPAVLAGDLAAPTIQATVLGGAFLAGSVIHVKSLLREAGRASFHRLNLGWHVGWAVAAGLVGPWWLLGFVPALLRAVALRPRMRPGAIGGVEAVISVLMVVAAFLAL